MNESITTRYLKIRDEIEKLNTQRNLQNKKAEICVVTKKQNLEACLEVIEAGATILGENYADEAVKKFDQVNISKIQFHMIGHLQGRKVKFLFPLFSTIQTIDGLEIAEKIDGLFSERKKTINSMIEINFTEENSKSGYKIDNQQDLDTFYLNFERLRILPGLNICGLMTMGYFPENPETNRKVFVKTRKLLENIRNKYQLEEFTELSMGTSGDYKTAIEEGATMVRIGEKIMGSRKVEVN